MRSNFPKDRGDTDVGICSEELVQLRRRLPQIRNTLISTLAFIYPIELLSPPDLLFTILDVPLPIPNGPTDPAPPLISPSRHDISEDDVATALGYAAQLVQQLAAYLGMGLVYPVTCIGSRSLIKDGISAMVGPRMWVLSPMTSTTDEHISIGFLSSPKEWTHIASSMRCFY